MAAVDPRSRNRATLLLLLLALSGLAAVSPAEAQIFFASRDGDTTYGWTFPDGEYPGGSATDETGDHGLQVQDTDAPLGTAPVYEAADLVRLAIDEPDADVLRIQIDVAGLDPQRALAENVFFGVRYVVDFRLAGADHQITSWITFGCQADQDPCEPLTDPAMLLYSTLYRVSEDTTTAVGRLPSRVDADQDRLEILVPRLALAAHGGKIPRADDIVTEARVESTSGFCITISGQPSCLRVADRLPDEGVLDLHALTLDTHGAVVRLDDHRPTSGGNVEGDNFQPLRPRVLQVDVDPEDEMRFSVSVANRADRKMLVRPTVDVIGEGDATVVVPETLEVPARESRRLLLSLKDIDARSPDDPLVLRLQIEAIGTDPPARDALLVSVRTVPTLSPDHPRLYLHTYGDDFSGLSEHGVDTFRGAGGVLNTLADDPLDHGKGARMHDLCFCINGLWDGWTGQSGLTRALHLDNESRATAHLALEVPVPGRLELGLQLYRGDQLVAIGEGSKDLDAGDQVMELPMRIDEEAAVLDMGDQTFHLSTYAWFRAADAIGGEFVGFAEPVNPRLKTQGETWLELPITDPEERYAEAAHLLLDRAPGVDRVQYLNPGKSALWNVTVTNQAPEADVVSFSVNASTAWATRFAPGTTYRLGPGESVTVGFLATAPEDAREAATATFDVQALSELGDGSEARIRLSAVVTTNIPIDEEHYVADNETRERMTVDTDAAESPVGVAPFVLTVLALWAVGRRGWRGASSGSGSRHSARLRPDPAHPSPGQIEP